MSDPGQYFGDESREKRPTAWKGALFLLVLAAVVAGLIYASTLMRGAEGPKVAVAEPSPLTVSVVAATPAETFALQESYSGLAEARRVSQLGFQSGGRIAAISADVGDRVKEGDTLARLDTRGLQAQLAAAEAIVEEARAAYDLALSTAGRQRTLQAQGHVAQQRVDEADAQANTALARIDAAKAQADTLRVQIDLSRIVAPFAGVVTQRMADEGAISAPGQPLLELVESGHLEASIGLPAASAALLVPGNAYELTADTGKAMAKLRTVTGVINASQRTVTAVFDIDDPIVVPAGAVVRLSLERDIGESGFWVPIKALSAGARGLWNVYVATPDGGGWRADPRPVEMVHAEGDRGFVRGPVQPGEKVIVDGLQRVTPGMRVTPVDMARADAGQGG